jgi:sterol 14alpha-demethylase
VVHPTQYKQWTIPAGHFICVSPSVLHRLPEVWGPNADAYDPERFERVGELHKFAYVPFGAGRHKCIGESFAYLQVKTVLASLVRHYEFELAGPAPRGDFTSMIALPTAYRMRYRRRARPTA